MKTPIELLRAIVADVEAVRDSPGSDLFLVTPDDPMQGDNVGVIWPNLAILIDEAKQVLESEK